MDTTIGDRLQWSDVRDLLRLLRINGWRHTREYKHLDEETSALTHYWRRDGEEQLLEVFVIDGTFVNINYMDVDTDDSMWSVCNAGVLNRAGLPRIANVLCALGVLSSASLWSLIPDGEQ